CGGPSQVRAVPSLLSHRHLFRFLSRCGPTAPYSCNMRARRFLFRTIPTRRTLSVTKVTSLVFIFFMSDIPLILFFAGLRNWRYRCNICVASSDKVSPLTTLSGAPRAQVLGYL